MVEWTLAMMPQMPISEPFPVDSSNQPPLAIESSTLLALGIDGHYGRACLLENIRGVYRLAAWLTIPRQGERHLGNQVASICRQLGSRLGRRLWDEQNHMPLLSSDDPTRYPPLAQLVMALSPRPALRVWLAGLTPNYSIEAARLAVLSSAAQVVGQSHLTVDTNVEQLSQSLLEQRPDVVILLGGYDTQSAPAHRPLHLLSTLVAGALQRIPRRSRPALFYAGNHWAAGEVQAILHSADAIVAAVPNVMPNPTLVRQDALAHALDEYYWRLCRRLDGFSLLERWHTSPAPMTTLEDNFIRLTQTWMALHNQAELYALYCGERWMHVWATEAQAEVAVAYSDPDSGQFSPPGWPPLGLVSGLWPDRSPLPASVRWWDRSGFAPIVAALGPVAPAAIYQTLSQDLLLPIS